MEVPDAHRGPAERRFRQLFEPDPDRAGVGNGISPSLVRCGHQFAGTDCVSNTDISKFLNHALAAIDGLRARGSHVHSITNTVAQNFTANVLLACNATVSMTANRTEIIGFVKHADVLHLNLGTIDDDREEAIRLAAAFANENDIPMLLDPVMIHRSDKRCNLARHLADASSVIKGNSKEIAELGNMSSNTQCIVETGVTDLLRQNEDRLSVSNGVAMLDRVIATGCALGAVIAALLPHAQSPITASLAGLLWFNIAGEIAVENANGPGSFQPALLDALYNVSTDTLGKRARLS